MKQFVKYILMLITAFFLMDYQSYSQWVQCEGPSGGNVDEIAVNGSNVFAGSFSGLFRSTDNGNNWERLNNYPTGSVTSLVIDGSTIYAAGGNFYYYSTNNGNSWNFKWLPGSIIEDMIIEGSNIYAITWDLAGFFVSTDNGLNWAQKNNGLPNSTIYSIGKNGSDIFVGVSDDGIYYSSDNGDNWSPRNNGIDWYTPRAITFNGGDIFIGVNGNGVYKSTNNGISWTRKSNGLTNGSVDYLAIDGTNIYAGTLGGIFLSTNNGESWTLQDIGIPGEVSVYKIAINAQNIFIGTSNGVFHSTNNGNNWAEKNAGLYCMPISAIISKNSDIFAANDSYSSSSNPTGIHLTTDNGDTWINKNNGLNNLDIQTLITFGSNIMTGTNGGGIFLSTDHGNSWIEKNNGLTNLDIRDINISGSNIYAGTWGGGVFLTTDNGNNWTEKNNGLSNSNILTLAINNSDVFAGTPDGGFFISTDNGNNWTEKNNGLSTYSVRDIVISDTSIFVGTNGGVFLSSDYGDNWIAKNNGLSNKNIHTLFEYGSNIISGAYTSADNNSVYLSSDNGETWTAKNDGFFGNMWVTSFCINENYIYAGTRYQSIFKAYLYDIISYLPMETAMISSSEEFCEGDSARIGLSSINNGVEPYSYSWNPTIGLTNPNDSVTWASPQTTTIYTLTITDAVDSTKQEQVTVTVNPLPDPQITSGDTSVCANNIMHYSSNTSGELNYKWIVSGGVVQGSDSSESANVLWGDAGTASLKLIQTNKTTGCMDSIEKVININPLPDPQLTSGDTSVCANNIMQYSSNTSGDIDYKWIVSGGAVQGSDSSESADVLWGDAGTANITLIQTNVTTGCTDSIEQEIVINPLPVPDILSGDTVVCANSLMVYSSNASATEDVKWDVVNGTKMTPDTDSSIEILWPSQGEGEITLKITNEAGCVDSIKQTVTISPLPEAEILSGETEVCEDDTVTYTSNANATQTVEWKADKGTLASQNGQKDIDIVWPIAGQGEITLIITDNNTLCSDTVKQSVKINARPDAVIYGKKNVIEGDVEIYYTDPGDSYEWEVEGGTGNATDNSFEVTWGGPGEGKVILKHSIEATGCYDRDTLIVLIDKIGSLPVPLMIDKEICTGDSVIIGPEDPVTGGDPPYDYKWEPSDGLNRDDIYNPKASPDQTTAYTLTVTDSQDRTGKATVTVTVNPLPDPQVTSGEFEVCKNDEITYSSNATAEEEIQWTLSGGVPQSPLDEDDLQVLWDQPGAGEIRLKLINTETRCADSITRQVTVHDLPEVTISGKNQVIEQDSEIYSAEDSTGRSSTWYVDTGHGTLDLISEHTARVNWLTDGDSYVVLVQTDAVTGCSDVDTMKILIDTLGALVLNAGSDKEICLGETVKIGTENPASGGQPPYQYKWMPAGGLDDDTSPDPAASPIVTTTYTLTVTDFNENEKSADVKVTVHPLPEPVITGNSVPKEKSTEEYSADTPAGTSNTWTAEGGTIAGESNGNTVTVSWAEAGSGTVRLLQENQFGCKDSAEKTITIEIEEQPSTLIEVEDTDFGDYVVDPTLKKRGSVRVTNLTNRPLDITTVESSSTEFTVVDYLKTISGNKTINVDVDFQPAQMGLRTGILTVETEGEQASGSMRGTGIELPDEGVITEMELSIDPNHAEVGEIVHLVLKLKSSENLNDDIRDFETTIGMNPYVLYHGNERHKVYPSETNVYYDNLYEDRPMNIEGRRRPGTDTLAVIELEVLLGTEDRTELVFKKSPVWEKDITLPVYTKLVDSLFIVDLCEAGGKRLLKHKIPETGLLSVYPNPADESINLEYFLEKDIQAELYMVNSFGEKSKEIYSGKPGRGLITKAFSTEGLQSGLYYVILRFNGNISAKAVMIVK